MAGKIELELTVLFINFITDMNSIKIVSFKINIRDRGSFGIQVDEEYSRGSKLADTSSTDLTDKRRYVGTWTKIALIISSGDLILEVLKRQVLISYFV